MPLCGPPPAPATPPYAALRAPYGAWRTLGLLWPRALRAMGGMNGKNTYVVPLMLPIKRAERALVGPTGTVWCSFPLICTN